MDEPKVKRAMNPDEVERNQRRKKAFEELKRINPKARWVDASKLVGYRNKGDKNSEEAFLRNIATQKANANAAAPAVPAPIAQSVWKNIKAQVNKDVLESGMKLNGIDRRALATSRKLNPGLTVANFMRNRVPHKRRTKKVLPKNSYNIQKAKNKAMKNYYNQKRVRQEQELLNFKPQGNTGRLENFLNRS